MAHESFLQKSNVYSGSLHADRHDLERCFLSLLKKSGGGGSYLTEINPVYLGEGK